MIIIQENNYGTMENKFKTKSTEVLRHSIMQITSENIGKRSENMIGDGENMSKQVKTSENKVKTWAKHK